MASLSYLLCWEYSPVAAFCWHTMIILFRLFRNFRESSAICAGKQAIPLIFGA
jgi:hypothetical protein